MRANENLIIVDEQVVLVPYRKEHVVKYHEWMADPTLQELTASEPLTLEEEYEMQEKWQQDEDKLTFIICARTNDHPIEEVTSPSLTMIGDVNLFLKGESTDPEFEVEVEIMIAEPAYRRKGLALTALQLMLSYATSPAPPFVLAATHAPLPVPREKLVVRIGDKNEPSIRLFQKLGFAITKHVEVFEEIEMRYKVLSNSVVQSHGGEEVGANEEVDGDDTRTSTVAEGTVLRWRAGDIKALTFDRTLVL